MGIGKRDWYKFGLVLTVAVLALVAGLAVVGSDDSYAATSSGDIKDSGENKIGTWTYNDTAKTILLEATNSAGVLNKCNGLGEADYSDCTVTVKGFMDTLEIHGAIEGFFTASPYNVPSSAFIYPNEIVGANGTLGTWSYDGTTLTLTPSADTSEIPVGLVGFTAGGSATDVIVYAPEKSTKRFLSDLTDFAKSVTSNSVTVTYQGELPDYTPAPTGNDNKWSYANNTLTVTSGSNNDLYNSYGSGSTTIFNGMFFTSDVTTITIHNFSKGGSYLFKDFPNAVTMNSDSITELYVNMLKTNGTSTTITTINFDMLGTLQGDRLRGNTVIVNVNTPNLSEIRESAFRDCTALEHVVVSNNLSVLQRYSFIGCTSLVSINTLGKISELNDNMFEGCTSLQSTGIENMTSLREIKTKAFLNSGITSIVIPDSCTTIGSYAFDGCTNLTSVTLGTGVSTINERAFRNTAITGDLQFPAALQTVKMQAFINCTNLTGALFNSSGALTINRQAFAYCTGLLTLELISTGTIEVGIDSYNGAFAGCRGLVNTTFEAPLIKIGPKSFTGCESLVELDFTNCGVEIGSEAFIKASVYINDGAWPDSNFGRLSSLRVVKFGSMASSIGSYAFGSNTANNACNALEYVDLGSNMTAIGERAFQNCTSLKGASIVGEDIQPIVFTDSLTSIGQYAFANCTSLTGIQFTEDCQITTVTTSCFEGDSSIRGSITLPKMVTTIYGSAFKSCTNITGITMLSPVLSTIESNAFQKCASLENVTINGAALTTLNSNVFNECTRLSEVRINGTILETISANAFSSCTSLETLIIDGSSLVTIKESAFNGCTMLRTFSFNSSSLTTIEKYAFQNCKNLQSFDFDNSVLTVIGNRAFNGCNSLTGDYTFPISLKKIEEYAFYNCWALGNITFSDVTDEQLAEGKGIKIIDRYAFANDWPGETTYRGILSVTIPDTLVILGTNAFHNSTKLTSAVIGWCIDEEYEGYTGTIGQEVFRGCVKLTSVELHEGITDIGPYAFRTCKSLTDVNLPNTLTSIKVHAFYDCTALVTIDLKHVADIGVNPFTSEDGMRVFYNCPNLTTVVAKYAANIYYRSFESCAKLTTITLGTTLATLEPNAFYYMSSLTTISLEDTGSNDVVLYSNGIYVNKKLVLYSSALTDAMSIMPGTTEIIKCVCYKSQVTGKISIPATVQTIGYQAFWDCNNITEVEILSAVPGLFVNESSQSRAFADCGNIKKVTFPIQVKIANVFCNKDGNERIGSGLTDVNIIGSGASGLGTYYTTYYNSVPWYRTESTKVTVTVGDGVNAIDAKMFFGATRIQKVFLGNNISTIGDSAFEGDSGIIELRLPANLTSSGSNAFKGCTNVATLHCPVSFNATAITQKFTKLTALTITTGTNNPVNYTSSNYNATPWSGSTNGYALTFQDDLLGIGSYMFYGNNIKAITFNDALQDIGECAFMGLTNTGYTTLDLPEGIDTIGDNAFKNCTRLTTAYLPVTFNYAKSIFDGCTALTYFYFTPGTNGAGTAYEIGTVTETVWYKVAQDSAITVYFMDGVKSIGSYMFYNCSVLSPGGSALGISAVDFPDTLTAIGTGAFQNCSNMSTVNFGSGLISIGKDAFSGCSGLGPSLNLPASLTLLGSGAFTNCIKITSMIIPISVNAVVDNGIPAFGGCSNLVSYTFIGSAPGFDYAGGETSDAYYGKAPWNTVPNANLAFADTTYVGDYMFRGMRFTSVSLRLPDTVTGIGDYAFADTTRLTTVYNQDGLAISSLTSIGDGAFENSSLKFFNGSELVSLTSVTEIGEDAFAGTQVISAVLGTMGIPMTIGNGAFKECVSLQTFTVNGTVNTLGYDMFRTRNTSTDFVSPLTTITAPNVTNFLCNLSVNFPNLTTVDISGATGFGSNAGLFKDCVKLTTVGLNTSAAQPYTLPAEMFKGCVKLSNINLTKVNLSRGHEFEGCTSLTAATLANSTAVSEYAFYGCTSLTTVTAPVALTIGAHAYENTAITNVLDSNFDSVQSIGDYAFAEISTLRNLVIPASLTSIGAYTFYNCGSLDNRDYSYELDTVNVATMGDHAFDGTAFKNLTIGADLSAIGVGALSIVALESIVTNPGNTHFKAVNELLYDSSCVELILVPSNISRADVALEGTLTTIRPFAAYGASLSGTLTIPTGVSTIGEYAFAGSDISALVMSYNSSPDITINVSPNSFADCTSLTSLVLSYAVRYADVFTGSDNIESIEFVGSPTSSMLNYYTDQNFDRMPWYSGNSPISVTFNPENNQIYQYMFYRDAGNGPVTSVTISEGITKIGNYAFANCSGISVLSIPSSVDTLGGNCLLGCSGITDLTVPISLDLAIDVDHSVNITQLSSITFIAGATPRVTDYTNTYTRTLWYSSPEAYSVTFGDGIASTGNGLRLKASSLSLSNDMRNIGTYAFAGSTLDRVELKNVTSIGAYAFSDCDNLLSVTLPVGIESVGENAFNGCDLLATLRAPIHRAYTAAMFSNCLHLWTFEFTYGGDGNGADYSSVGLTPWKAAVNYATPLSPRIVFVSDDILSIGDRMFDGCYAEHGDTYGISGTVSLPTKLVSIGQYAFNGCAKITGTNLASCNFLETIGAHAFDGCTALRGALILGSSLETVGEYAFGECSSIESITLGDNVTSIGAGSFQNCTSVTSLSLPISLNAAGSYMVPAFSGCTIGSVTFTGSAPGYDYSLSSTDNGYYLKTPWNLSSTPTFAFSGITEIGDNTFRGCTAFTGDLVLPESVTAIGEGSFYRAGINSISAGMVQSIGASSFMESSVGTVNLPKVTAVPDNAFRACASLLKATFGNVTSIGNSAFMGSAVKTINDGTVGVAKLTYLLSLGDSAFAESGVVNVTLGSIGNGLTMGASTFARCPALRFLTIDGSVTDLPADTFKAVGSNFVSTIESLTANHVTRFLADMSGFTSLERVELSDTTSYVATIAGSQVAASFRDCTALTSYTMCDTGSPSSLVVLPASMFENCIALTNVNLDSINLVNGREFYGCTSLTTANIPNSAAIPAYSFYGCTNLSSVIADSAVTVGEYAFYATGITAINALSFPAAVSFGAHAFENCASLTSLYVPVGLTAIGEDCFIGTALIDIVDGLMPSVTTVGDNAFRDVATLTGEVHMPKAVSVGENAFSGTSLISMDFGKDLSSLAITALGADTLVSVTVDEQNSNFATYDRALYTKDYTKLIFVPRNAGEDLELKDGLQIIYDYAAYHANITGRLVIPASVTSVGAHAFEGTGITELVILCTGVDSISATAFKDCASLTTLTLPFTIKYANVFVGTNNVTAITFTGSRSSKLGTYYSDRTDSAPNYSLVPWYAPATGVSVTFSSGIEEVDAYMFYHPVADTKVTSVTLPAGLTKIGQYAFANCAGITSLTLPDSMETIDEGALAGCNGITSLSVPIDLEMSIDSAESSKRIGITGLTRLQFTYGSTGVGTAYSSDDRDSLIWSASETPFEVVFGDGITSTGSYMYLKASSVNFPAELVTIGAYAFSDSTFSSVTFTPKITTIGEYAFAGSSLLTSVSLPSGMTSIGDYAFKDCVRIDSMTAPITMKYTSVMFDGCTALDEFTFTRGSNGVGADYLSTDRTPWRVITETTTNPVISLNDDIVRIGEYMFSGCFKTVSSTESRGIAGTVTLPRSLESIGDSAFEGDRKITAFTFSRCTSLRAVGAHAFDGCDGLTTITLGTSVNSLGANAFANCGNISALVIPIMLNAVGDNDRPAFEGTTVASVRFVGTVGCTYYEDPSEGPWYQKTPWYMSGTTSVNLEDVTSVGDNMFRGCSAIAGDIRMPNVVSIGDYAFAGTSIVSVQALSVTFIGDGSFEDSAVGSINLPLITSIPRAAFKGTASLASATFGQVTAVGAEAFMSSSVSKINSTSPDTIDLPSLVSVGDRAFSGSGAVNVTLGSADVPLDFGTGVLKECDGLKAVSIPGTVNELSADTFKTPGSDYVPTLTSLTANAVTKFSCDLSGAASLTSLSITGTTQFGAASLKDCTALRSVGLYSANQSPSKTEALVLPASMFENCAALATIDTNNLDLRNGREFYGCTSLASVTVPMSATIPAMSFFECTSLASVTAAAATSIGTSAFENCGISSAGSSSFPVLVTIGSRAFYGCASMASFHSTAALTSIGSEAFEGTAVASITGTLENVTEVGREAFKDVSPLTGAVSLVSAVSIGDGAFDGTSVTAFTFGPALAALGDLALRCPQLASITFTEENPNFDMENGILFNEGKTTMIVCPAKNAVDDLVLPDTLKNILHYAAYGSSLTGTVTLPASIATSATVAVPVAEYAFAGSTGITGLDLRYLGQSVTAVTTFEGCTGITSLRVSNTVMLGGLFAFENRISSYTFFGGQSSGLENYYENHFEEMPWAYAADGVEISIVFESGSAVDKSMFRFAAPNTSIVSVDLGPVSSIGNKAFMNCAGLRALVIPDGVRSLEVTALTGCSGLREITLPISLNAAVNGNGNVGELSLTTLHFTPGTGTGYSYENNYEDTLWYSATGTYNVYLDEGIVSIGDNMYLKPLDNVTFPSSLRSIGANAFCNSSMDAVILNAGLTTLGDNAFGSTPITRLTIPDSLVVSDTNAAPFKDCTQLASVSLPITIKYANHMFDGCVNLISFTFTKGGNGIGCDYSETEVTETVWYEICQTMNITVSFGPGVVSVGTNMFRGCTGPLGNGVSGTVDLSGITSVSAYAFSGCSNMSEVIFGNSMETIGERAFENCTRLSSITLGSSVKGLSSGTFYNCYSIRSLSLPASLDAVRNDDVPAFALCTGITSVELTGQTEGFPYSDSYGSNSWYQNTPWFIASGGGSTISLTIANGVTSIGKNTFRGCSGLDGAIVLPVSVKSVGDYAFSGCTGMDSLEIRFSLTSIGKGAFADCSSVRSLTMPISINAVYYESEPIFEGTCNLERIHFTGANGFVYSASGSINHKLTPWYTNTMPMTVTFETTVQSIGAYTFCGCANIQDAIDLKNVTSVGDYAFQNCSSVRSVTADKVANAGKSSFEGCSEMTQASMSLLKSVSDSMFRNTESMSTLTLHPNCTTIGPRAFENSGVQTINSATENVANLRSVTSVGAYAFAGSRVVNVVIGSTGGIIGTFGDYVFYNCQHLQTVEIAGTVNTLPYNTFRTEAAMNYTPRLTSLTARKVTNFYANLSDFRELRTVDIQGTTSFIPAGSQQFASFKGCTSLESVTLYRESATSAKYTLPRSMFEGCAELSTINLTYANISSQNGREFYGCGSLPSVEMLYTGAVADYSFYGCTLLQSVSAPKATTVGAYAFAESGLVEIDEDDLQSVTAVSSHAFDSCQSLVSVIMNKLDKVNATSEVSHDQTGAYTDVFYGCTSLTTVRMDSLGTISSAMFFECDRLSSITADKVKKIEVLAFYGCGELTSVSFPIVTELGVADADVTYVDGTFTGVDSYSVFYNCDSLSYVSMPKLESVGALAFYRCSALTAFNDGSDFVLGDTVGGIGTAAFASIGAANISVGATAANGIKRMSDYAFFACPQMVSFVSVSLTELPEHTFNNSDVNARPVASQIATIDVPAVTKFFANLHGITSLTRVSMPAATEFNDAIFYGCTGLTTVELRTSGTVNLSARMFYNCTALSDINLEFVKLPANTQTVNSGSTFYGCTSLRSVTLNIADVVSAGAFQGCTSLRTVEMPKVATVGKDAFNGCLAMTTVTAPVMTAVEENAFYGCTSFGTLNVNADGVSGFIRIASIGPMAFYGCAFTEAVLGPQLREMGAYAFSNNRLLNYLVLPNSLSALNEGAFYGCPITEAYISSSVRTIANKAFDYGVTDTATAKFYFNGELSGISFAYGAINGVNKVALDIYGTHGSADVFDELCRDDKVLSPASWNVTELDFGIVRIDADDDSVLPYVSNIHVLYGSRFVLPYYSSGTGFVDYYFATLNGGLLSLFASEADFENGRVARSGDDVPLYPLEDNGGVDIRGFNTLTPLEGKDTIVIVTNGNGEAVRPESVTVHYGMLYTIPHFESEQTHVSSIIMIGAGNLEISIPETTKEIYIGYAFNEISMQSADTKVTVYFFRDDVRYSAEVLLRSPFQYPDSLKDERGQNVLEIPEPGYEFIGWYSAASGGYKADETTTFKNGQTWYARFSPLSYVITVMDSGGVYATAYVTGPYVLYNTDGNLYYTDLNHTEQTLIIKNNDIEGYWIELYMDSGYKTIETRTDVLVDDRSVVVKKNINYYTVNLQFLYNGTPVSDDVVFTMNGWGIGSERTYTNASDPIANVPFTIFKNGLMTPAPLSDNYTLSQLIVNGKVVSYTDKYIVDKSYLTGSLDVNFVFVLSEGQYAVEYRIGDDAGTVVNNGISYSEHDTITMIADDNYTRVGYTFVGFRIAGHEGTLLPMTQIALSREMINESQFCVVTAEGVWAEIDYTIKFDLAGYTGAQPPASIENVIIGDTIILPDTTSIFRIGQTITGWHFILGEDKASTVSHSDPFVLDKTMIEGYSDDNRVITMQCEWSAKSYTVRVDPNAGTKQFLPMNNIQYNDTIILWEIGSYTKSFMMFGGWSVGEDGTRFASGASAKVDDELAYYGDTHNGMITFYFFWVPYEYSVQYKLDGGEGDAPVDNNVYEVNNPETPLVLADSSGFEKAGYTFVGWRYSLESSVIYVNTSGLFESILAQSADANGIVTFYAVWSQKEYLIEYNLKGGVAGPYAPQSAMYGEDLVISAPTQPGFDFAGWRATTNATETGALTKGAQYFSSNSYKLWDGSRTVNVSTFRDLCSVDQGKVTFEAMWDNASYSVSYDKAGGSGTVVGGMTNIRVKQIIALPQLTDAAKTGYTFRGWSVDRVNPIAPGTEFTTDMVEGGVNTVVFYAVWETNPYTVQYRYLPEQNYISMGTMYTSEFSIPTYDRPGYAFAGWDINGADSNAYWSPDGVSWYKLGSATVTGTYFKNLTSSRDTTVTINALWKPIQYRIAYSSNGGTGVAPVDSNLYTVGSEVVLKDYHVLDGTNGSKIVTGWSLDANGSVTSFRTFTEGLASRADATGTVNLYAAWAEGLCTVTVDLSGITVSEVPSGWTATGDGKYTTTVEYGTSMKDVMSGWEKVTLSKDGYTFSGWNYGSGTVVSNADVEPTFEKVDMKIAYVFGGVVAALVVGIIAVARFKF